MYPSIRFFALKSRTTIVMCLILASIGAVVLPGREKGLAQEGAIAYEWQERWDFGDLPRLPTVTPAANPFLEDDDALDVAPIDIAIDAEGRVFVANGLDNSVLEFSKEGTLVGQIKRSDLQDSTGAESCADSHYLSSIALDAWGAELGRDPELHILWRCSEWAAPQSTVTTRVTDTLESRNLSDLGKGRVLHPFSTGTSKLSSISVDPSTGYVIHATDRSARWINPKSGEVIQQRSQFDERVFIFGKKVVGLNQLRYAFLGHTHGSLEGGWEHLLAVSSGGRVVRRMLNIGPAFDSQIFALQSGQEMVAVFDGSRDDLGPGQGIPKVESFSTTDLGLPPPPLSQWPWQISVSEAGFAFYTIKDGHFHIGVFDRQGNTIFSIRAAKERTAYTPEIEFNVPGIALSSSPQGDLGLLDYSNGVFELDSDGQAQGGWPIAPDIVDFAFAEDRWFLADSQDALYQQSPTTNILPISPSELSSDSAIGAATGGVRLAFAGNQDIGTLFASSPLRSTVYAIHPASKTLKSKTTISETGNIPTGLWPSDITSSPAGVLYTANLSGRRIERWSTTAPGTMEEAFPVGLLHGPWRIAYGPLPDEEAGLAILTADYAVEVRNAESGALVSRFLPYQRDSNDLIQAHDIALDAQGRVLLAEQQIVSKEGERRLVNKAVHVFASSGPAPTLTPRQTLDPLATPTATPEWFCTLTGNKRVSGPTEIVLGETTDIELTIHADCPPRVGIVGADIAIVMDRSGSMTGSGFLGVTSAVKSLLQLVDTQYHQAGLVSFAANGTMDHPLTDNLAPVLSIVDQLRSQGRTNVLSGIQIAGSHLEDEGRSDALPVIILLSDGNFENKSHRDLVSGLRGKGVQFFVIGYGRSIDRDDLSDIAGSPERYYEAASPGELIQVYRQIIREVQSAITGSVIIDDVMGANIDFLSQSSSPAAIEGPNYLKWGVPILPKSGITFTYSIRPTTIGRLPTNLWAVARLKADGGIDQQFEYPVPEVVVIAPSPTPTPTPKSRTVFLPLLLRENCTPQTQSSDIVLVIDASRSMLSPAQNGETKMRVAIKALSQFLKILDLDQDGVDRAAVISFNSHAELVHDLSSDRFDLTLSLETIRNESGTRIDLGIESATDLLSRSSRRGEASPVMILLTDGHANPVPIEVAEERAGLARAKGIAIFTIGLGANVETESLERIAGGEDRYYAAASALELDEIYGRIATSLPCPPDSFWGNR